MAQMLRHKETGELFIWTSHLAALSELELVVEDPVAKVVAEMAAQEPVAEPVAEPMFVPSFIEAPVAEVRVEKAKDATVKVSALKRGKAA